MVTKCKNGHWYDPNVNRSCPHCKRDSEKLSLAVDNIEEDDRTISIAEIDISLGEQLGQIVGESIGDSIEIGNVQSTDDDRTISFGFFGITKIQPVVGWVVCLTGEEKGKDYRLHSGKNFVGRGTSMDISLIDDKSISRDKHCSITYDPKGNTYYLSPEGGNIVYCNETIVEDAVILQENDKVMLGDTVLVFIPYCKEGRTWEE